MRRKAFRTDVRFRCRKGRLQLRWTRLGSIVAFVLIGCESSPLAPRPGLPQYRELATIALPGAARLDLAGGNLLVTRTDLDIDTRLGPLAVGAVWNSATRRWSWSFDDVSLVDGSFRDATGAVHAIGSLAPGQAIPGTTWVKGEPVGAAGPQRLKSKGGLEYAFTNTGRPLTIRWTTAPNPHLRFTQALQGDGAQHTSAIEQCSGVPLDCRPVYTIQYDDSGRVREIADRAGRRATFTYDAAGRLATARDGLDTATGRPGYRYEYSGQDLAAITNSEGERVEYAYDGFRRVVRVTQIGMHHPTHSFSYHGKKGSQPYRTTATDPAGALTVYRYDGEYRLLAVESVGSGETTRFAWSQRRVTSRTAPSGATTHWAYADDDVVFRADPGGNITSYQYRTDAVDRVRPMRRPLRRVTDLAGTLEVRDYDAVGRLVSIANGAGETLSFEYGDDEMVSGFKDPAGIETSLSGYGEHGHPTAVSRAGNEQIFAYDAVGNLTEGPDRTSASGPGHGGIVSRSFDEDRNVTVVMLSDLAFIAHESDTLTTVYRSDRKPLLVARPAGGDDVFVYDELGRLVRRRERVDGQWRDTSFGYDVAGRLRAIDRANGTSQQWTRDAQGRVTTHAIRSGTATESFSAFAWADGLLRSFFDSRSGLETYAYDEAGRLTAVAYGNGDRAILSWDLRSRATGLSLERSHGVPLRTLALTYDAAGRERGVFDNGVPVIERTWSDGRLQRTIYGNGLVRDFAFDPSLGGLAGMTMRAGSSPIESTSVDMADPDCHLLATRCLSSETTSEGSSSTTTTLERHHLMSAVASQGSPRAGQRVGVEDGTVYEAGVPYSYDVLSNLRLGPAGELAYNAERNRLLSIVADATGTLEYSHDAAGFVTSRGGVPLTWDGAGRIASYGSDSFEWDTLGRPVSSTVDGVRTTRLFGGLVEADGAGHPTAIDLGEVRVDLAGTDTRYRHFDYRGNVKLVTDSGGAVVMHSEYSAYAIEATHGADTGADTKGFARGRTVGDLILIGHRLYDPAAARFLAPDPIHQLINQYAYTLGNPVEFWDPSGAQAVTSDQAAGAMMQAAGNSFVAIGSAVFVAGLGSFFVPVPGVNVFTGTALLGIGLNFIVLGEGLQSLGGLLQSGGGGPLGLGEGAGGFGGIFAPLTFNEHVGFSCGAEPCPGSGGNGGLSELQTLGNLGGPTPGVGGGGGAGCAPIALGEGRLPDGSLAVLLLVNLAVAASLWRRARTVPAAARDI